MSTTKNDITTETKQETPGAESPSSTEAAPKKVRKRKYVNNRDLLIELEKSNAQDRMTDKLAHMLQTLCKKYGSKANFAGYTYNDDMQAYAMMMLVRTWRAFDAEKGSNPFAFFTQCVKNSFIQYLKHESRQRDVKDELLVKAGLNPSYGYQVDHESKEHTMDAEPVHTLYSSDENPSDV